MDRRSFLRKTPLGVGVAIGATSLAASNAVAQPAPAPRKNRLPREVWVASISQNGMKASGYRQMIAMMLARMEEVVCYEPDIICLPEVFPFVNLADGRPPLAEVAENPIGPICRPFAEFARKHRCNVVCPIYTKEDGRYYNASVFLDRDGELLGEYRKIHPTIGEMENGITPGPLDAPVFQADFGKVGSQICFDIQWPDGWQRLGEAGAEIVFWPSAFGGGSMVNTMAWQHRYCVVSSTRKGITKICDVCGEEVARTGQYDRWVCAPLNLEKVMLHTWPYCQRFKEIQAKYGRKVRIKTFHEEEWTVIESRSPDVRVAEIMDEFELKTHREHIHAADLVQNARRP